MSNVLVHDERRYKMMNKSQFIHHIIVTHSCTIQAANETWDRLLSAGVVDSTGRVCVETSENIVTLVRSWRFYRRIDSR